MGVVIGEDTHNTRHIIIGKDSIYTSFENTSSHRGDSVVGSEDEEVDTSYLGKVDSATNKAAN